MLCVRNVYINTTPLVGSYQPSAVTNEHITLVYIVSSRLVRKLNPVFAMGARPWDRPDLVICPDRRH